MLYAYIHTYTHTYIHLKPLNPRPCTSRLKATASPLAAGLSPKQFGFFLTRGTLLRGPCKKDPSTGGFVRDYVFWGLLVSSG